MVDGGGKVNPIDGNLDSTGLIDEVPVAADAPGVPLLAVWLVGTWGERIVAVGGAGIKFEFPRQHLGAILKVLPGERALAGGGVEEVERARRVVAGVEAGVAGDGERQKVDEGVAVGQSVGGSLGFGSDGRTPMCDEIIQFERGRTALGSGCQPVGQLVQVGESCPFLSPLGQITAEKHVFREKKYPRRLDIQMRIHAMDPGGLRRVDYSQ